MRMESDRMFRLLEKAINPATSRSGFNLDKEIGEIAGVHGVSEEKIRKQVEMGKVVEREHDDLHAILFPFLPKWMTLEVFAEFIVLAHVRESEKYYSLLDKMEKSF